MHVLGQRMKVLEGRESAGYDAVELTVMVSTRAICDPGEWTPVTISQRRSSVNGQPKFVSPCAAHLSIQGLAAFALVLPLQATAQDLPGTWYGRRTGGTNAELACISPASVLGLTGRSSDVDSRHEAAGAETMDLLLDAASVNCPCRSIKHEKVSEREREG